MPIHQASYKIESWNYLKQNAYMKKTCYVFFLYKVLVYL